MARPKSTELTTRELAVMQLFWQQADATAEQAKDYLLLNGEDLAHATVANVVRGLADKGYLEQVNRHRPFRYRALRTFDDVSRRIVGELVSRVFQGSRESLLVQLLGRQKLTPQERDYLQGVLCHQESET